MNEIVRIDDPSGGKMVNIKAPNGIYPGADSTINVHLMPGSLIIFQQNKLGDLTTFDMVKNGEITIIINRDQHKHAEGMVYLDHGESISELTNKLYEYYKFNVNDKTLTKWILNEDLK